MNPIALAQTGDDGHLVGPRQNVLDAENIGDDTNFSVRFTLPSQIGPADHVIPHASLKDHAVGCTVVVTEDANYVYVTVTPPPDKASGIYLTVNRIP